MRFLRNHTIMMSCGYGLHILIVMILSCTILLFPPTATAQERITRLSSYDNTITRFSQIAEAEPTNIDPTTEDPFEPDNMSDKASPVAIQIAQGKVLKQLRTFHSETDRDWIYFYGLKQFQYYFCIEVYTEWNRSVRMSLFDAKALNQIWGDQVIKNNYYNWQCPRNGHLALKLEPVFTNSSASPEDANAFTYRFWMYAMPPPLITLSGGVYGRVINQDGKGINRVHILLKNGAESREDMTDSIGEIWEIPLEPSKIDGWFFIDGLYANSAYELIVTDEADSNNYLVPPLTINLSERNIERIQDIQIAHPVEPPYDPNNTLFYMEILYEIWQNAIDPNGILPKWLDTNDLDGFVNIEEFLNGTHPFLYSIECPITPRLILLPFYLNDPYTAGDFCVQFLNEWQSIWGYDKENKRWKYWDANANGENFTLQYGTGYTIYKQTHRTIYQELQSEASFSMPEINPGINICPIPLNPQEGPYSSYEFINNEDPNGIICMSRYNNTQGSKGAWESTYRFFGRPAGRDFSLTPEDAYIIGVK
jgi:hypothetical protein